MGNKLYVGNVSYQVIGSELEEAFSRAGVVKSAKIITDPGTGRSRGFAFVEMASDEEARKAIEMLHGFSLKGRAIIVNEARPKRSGPSGSTNPRNQDRHDEPSPAQ